MIADGDGAGDVELSLGVVLGLSEGVVGVADGLLEVVEALSVVVVSGSELGELGFVVGDFQADVVDALSGGLAFIDALLGLVAVALFEFELAVGGVDAGLELVEFVEVLSGLVEFVLALLVLVVVVEVGEFSFGGVELVEGFGDVASLLLQLVEGFVELFEFFEGFGEVGAWSALSGGDERVELVLDDGGEFAGASSAEDGADFGFESGAEGCAGGVGEVGRVEGVSLFDPEDAPHAERVVGGAACAGGVEAK